MASKPRVTDAIGTLIAVFHEYGSKDKDSSADRFTLSKAELKELAQKEMDISSVKNSARLDELMKELDDDGDKQVDFKEFFEWVTNVAFACNAFMESHRDAFF